MEIPGRPMTVAESPEQKRTQVEPWWAKHVKAPVEPPVEHVWAKHVKGKSARNDKGFPLLFDPSRHLTSHRRWADGRL